MILKIFIIILCIIFLGWEYLKYRSRRHFLRKNQVREDLDQLKKGQNPWPSWIGNDSKLDEFLTLLLMASKHKKLDIPKKFTISILKNEMARNTVFFTCGLLENRGGSFNEQIMMAMEIIEKAWNRLSLNNKKDFREVEK